MTGEYEGAEPGAQLEAQAAEVCRVEVWTTAKGVPQWKVRVVEGTDEGVVDDLVIQGVRAYRKLEEQLTGTEREPWPPAGGQQ